MQGNIRLAKHAGSWYEKQSNLSPLSLRISSFESSGQILGERGMPGEGMEEDKGSYWSPCRLCVQWTHCRLGIPVLAVAS